jgi:sialidase-1
MNRRKQREQRSNYPFLCCLCFLLFKVACVLKPELQLCIGLVIVVNAQRLRAGAPEVIDVFVPNSDGFKSIRIPSVVVSQKGTLLAFAEGRAANTDQAKNKIILKRSTDGGHTWGPLAVIADGGERSLNNPCAVVESGSGTILLMFQSYPAGVRERSDKIQTGYEGELVVRNLMVSSGDDGATWSAPRDVTRQTKRPEKVTTMASGPGIGIQLRRGPHAGRMLFPFNEGPYGQWNIYAVYSDDKGNSWQFGEIAPGGMVDAPGGGKPSDVNEVQFVELKDGSIRANARRWAGAPFRKTCVSNDGGPTWSKVEAVPELHDPSCMASIFRYSDPADGDKSRILYSGPQSAKRENGTVFVSYDEGATWPVKRVLCEGPFAYSVLTKLPDGTIGCLYEADDMKRIVFARFTLDWLTAGHDRLDNRGQ